MKLQKSYMEKKPLLHQNKLLEILLLEKGFGAKLPEIRIKSKEIENGLTLVDFLSVNNIVPSKSEARRIIANNGLKMNNILVEDVKEMIQVSDFKDKILKLSCGKKKHYLVKII